MIKSVWEQILHIFNLSSLYSLAILYTILFIEEITSLVGFGNALILHIR